MEHQMGFIDEEQGWEARRDKEDLVKKPRIYGFDFKCLFTHVPTLLNFISLIIHVEFMD